jgi:hypothetical protein
MTAVTSVSVPPQLLLLAAAAHRHQLQLRSQPFQPENPFSEQLAGPTVGFNAARSAGNVWNQSVR